MRAWGRLQDQRRCRVLPAVQIVAFVDPGVEAALRARALEAGRSLEAEVRLALVAHLGHARLGGEMQHRDDVARGGRW